VKLNRLFIFLIRDIETNTILFIGQVMDPSEGVRLGLPIAGGGDERKRRSNSKLWPTNTK